MASSTRRTRLSRGRPEPRRASPSAAVMPTVDNPPDFLYCLERMSRDGCAILQKLVLTGGPRARGRAHGEALRDRIARGLDTWEETLRPPEGVSIAEDRAAFLAAVDVEPSLKRWVPGVVDEIEGIAEGANQPRDRLLAYNLLDEHWCWDVARRRLPQASLGACSAIGLGPDRLEPPLIAQNLDLPYSFDGTLTVLEVDADDEPKQLLLTSAGTIGYCGANERGVGVCCNALPSLSFGGNGVPVLGVVRGILQRDSRDEASRFVSEIPHASPQNYLVGDPTGVTSFECSSHACVTLLPQNGGIWHTNHPLANKDQVHDETPELLGSSFERGAFLTDRISKIRDKAEVLATLRDRTVPVSRVGSSPQESHTWGTIVSELTRPPHVAIAPGPPDRVPFETAWPGPTADETGQP
jgi:isopenicillin-N N-acyltransferase-like protein